MEAKDLMFFNKEGYQMNLRFKNDVNYHYGSMYFDKNSTDTFKTLGIYMFEKVAPTNYTFDAYTENYQLFNYNDINARPSKISTPITITNIKKSNNSSLFFSKWIYADNVEKYLKPGDWFYFNNLTAFYPSFSTLIGADTRIYQVILSEPGRILIIDNNANNLAYPTYNISYNGEIVPVSVVEHNTLNPLESTLYTNRIYKGKKIQIISDNTKNDDILTILHTSIPYNKKKSALGPSVFLPSIGDSIILDIELFSDRIQLSTGNTEFSVGSYTPIVGTDSIKLPYIPKFLKIGDTIIAEEKTTPILGPNTATFTIVYIDYTLNIVEINAVLSSQIVDCYMYLASNHFIIQQKVAKDNNNALNLALTYWSIVQGYKEILKAYGIDLSYDTTTNNIEVTQIYAGQSYYTATLKQLNNAGTVIATYPFTVTSPIIVLPHVVEKLSYNEVILKDSSKYSRKIVFNTIDNDGLNIVINNKLYDVDFNVNAVITLNDWYVQYTDELTKLGIIHTITTTTIANDTLILEPEFENLPINVSLRMGDFSDYYVIDSTYDFFNIKTQLLININGIDYVVPFSIDDNTTVLSWINTYNAILKTRGVIVLTGGASQIVFAKLDSDGPMNITYNIGYIPKSGDDSIVIVNYATENSGSLIYSAEIKVTPNIYNFLDYYSSGQKITITSPQFDDLLNGGRNYLNNRSYNILDLNDNTLWLSYQGPFWDQLDSLNLFQLTINSDFFLRYPREGISTSNNRTKYRWTWKDTQTDEIFLYDISGSQLKPIYPNFPDYNGPLPLCGEDGTIPITLNKFKNDKLEHISNPAKQQTVFDYLEYDSLFIDEEQNPNELVSPMQVFIGYKQEIESWVKSRLYLEKIEDTTFSLDTQINLNDNVWNFNDNVIEVISPNTAFDFNQLGFKEGQYVEISSLDITNNDGKKLAILDNNGKIVRIKEVMHNKLIIRTNDLYTETSVKTVSKSTVPYYDSNGVQLLENRILRVTLTVQPQLLAYFDIYGESEGEDERHTINLNNKNFNILQLKDFFIFKEVDINENGIDWIILNRKRKELLEIYPQIFNNVSSYKSIIQAINFFGYNDLTFTEYFQNINPDSKKFGHLFNMDLLNIFDKSVKGWSYSNLAIDNLKNQGFKKTNLFSLNYRITDLDGNFIDAYSREEVQIKLNGLKRWLTENLVPMGAKITDINGKFNQPLDWIIKHDTYKSQGIRVEEYSNPIDFDVDGYLQPISLGSDNYDITVHPKCAGNVEWYDYKVRTFSLANWDTTYFYLTGTKLLHNGIIWEALTNIAINEEPGISSSWVESSIDKLEYTQIFTDSKYDLTPWSFTISELLDPHFIVEVNWHSGYGCTWQIRKAYSVIQGFFDQFNI